MYKHTGAPAASPVRGQAESVIQAYPEPQSASVSQAVALMQLRQRLQYVEIPSLSAMHAEDG